MKTAFIEWKVCGLREFNAPLYVKRWSDLVEALSRIIGVRPAFFRPPFGNSNDNIRQIAYARNQSRSFSTFYWYILYELTRSLESSGMLYRCEVYIVLVNKLSDQAMWDQDTQDADGATVAFSKQQYTNAVNQKVNSMLFLNHEPYGTVHCFLFVSQMLIISISC